MPKTIDTLICPKWIACVDEANTVHQDTALAIDQGIIVGIGPATTLKVKYQADQEHEMPNHLVLPGFVNAHTHAAMSLMKGMADDLPLMTWLEQHIWPVEQKLIGPEFIRDGVNLAMLEMVRSGTTCFNDMYFFPEAAAEAIDNTGMRACLGMIAIDFPSAYAANGPEYLAKGINMRQQLGQHPLITTALAPHAPYTVGDELLTEISDIAAAEQLPIHMHLHETVFEVESAAEQTGARPFERLKNLGLFEHSFMAVHMTQLNEQEIKEAAELNLTTVHCPSSNMKLASGFCPIPKLIDAGCNIALGTDGSASNNDLDMLQEMRLAALLAKGQSGNAAAVPAHEVVRMATINGAKALGLDHQIGSIEVGKQADCIAVDLSDLSLQPVFDPIAQLVYNAKPEHVVGNWVAGKPLMWESELQTLDTTEIAARTEYWQEKIRETVA